MKLILRSMIAALFLIALAMPSLAQSPNVAIRIASPSRDGCFRFTVKNLRTTVVTAKAVYLTIVDQSNCTLTCEAKLLLKTKLKPCENYTFKICCSKPLPPRYIAYVRVNHSLGDNEQWFYRP